MDAKLAVAQRRDEFVSAFNREDVNALCDLCEPDIIQDGLRLVRLGCLGCVASRRNATH
jgi:hypothetical protein